MPLSCGYCDTGGDWFWDGHSQDFVLLDTKRGRRCESCNQIIKVSSDCIKFNCYRPPNNYIEERINGDQVRMADKYLCESCGGLWYSLQDLGFNCLNLGEDMKELAREYNHDYIVNKPK